MRDELAMLRGVRDDAARWEQAAARDHERLRRCAAELSMLLEEMVREVGCGRGAARRCSRRSLGWRSPGASAL